MQTLVITSGKYANFYVALASFKDTKIVGKGKTPDEAFEEAEKNGVDDPVILFVPEKDQVQVY